MPLIVCYQTSMGSEVIFTSALFFLALIALFFAWSVWIANKRPEIATWRLASFKSGLILAPAAIVMLIPGSAHYLRTGTPAEGIWLVANWIGISLWVCVIVTALTGKGRARTLLVVWGILAFLGVFVANSFVP